MTSSMREFALALNKLLCGVELGHVFDFGQPIADHEIEECELFLAAVPTNAPSLGELSNGEMRGCFLLREGRLGTIGDVWHLQVERQTHLLLDRLPWSSDWVRLPWMKATLQVEW